MTLESAEHVFDWSNWFLLGALIVGVVSTFLVIVSATIKEAHLKDGIAKAGVRASMADERAAHASERVAELNKETARLSADAESARLELARFKAHRKLDIELLGWIDVMAKKYPGTTFFFSVNSDPESTNLMVQLGSALRASGWQWVDCELSLGMWYPTIPMSCHTVLFGIEIQSSASLAPAANELIGILRAGGIKADPLAGDVNPTASDMTINELNAIHILVGAKPPE